MTTPNATLLSRPKTTCPIAVIGVGALFPGSVSSDGFWQTIMAGRDCLTDVPLSHWRIDDYYDADGSKPGKTYARRGAFLPDVSFDPIDHGMPPNVVSSTDTAQLLSLIVAKRVLESSCGLQFSHISRERTSVILGVASATELVSTMSASLQRPVLVKALRESGLPEGEIDEICDRVAGSYVNWTENTFPGLLGNVVAGRIANRFDLGGTNCVIDAACASSLGAVQMAMQELWSGSADMVITGGVDAINDIFMYMCFSKTFAMSRTGDCRPFSADADGTMLGEGIGMFALRRLEDAERDGDRIYAVLRGIGSSSDGKAKSIYAPRPEGQAKALRRAYESAGYTPDTVEMVEAHGTGTNAGDAAEVRALKDVFGHGAKRETPWCALGSIKSQIGHTKAAAGAASLYKAVMALHHKVLPPTIKVSQPNPALELDTSPFYLNTEARPWIRASDHPRRASVSAFGFGGSNFHVALEEYQGSSPRPPRIRTAASELFLFSADKPDSLLKQARDLSLVDCFAEAARESQQSFSANAPRRLAIVAIDENDFASKLERAAAAMRGDAPFWQPTGIAYGTGEAQTGQIAFLFPGQGSQYLGMGAGLAMTFDDARQVWDNASSVTPGLAEKVFPQPVFSTAERTTQTGAITATDCAQPAIGLTSQMYLQLLRSAGLQPSYCAGHSFGEVTALYGAGVVSSEDFLRIANKRGSLMADAAASVPGAMVAVAAPASEVESLLPPGVVIANINSPRQVVLGGPVDRIAAVEADFAARGLTVRRLPVSTAFHSPMVENAAGPFTEFLNEIDFKASNISVYSNTTAAVYPESASEMRALLGAQLAKPVRFAEEIDALYQAGARIFIEVGPASVLTDLTATCLEGRPHLAVATDTKGKDAVTGLWFALARIAVAGVPFDTAFAWRGYEAPTKEKVKSSPVAISINGANYGKKYPQPGDDVIVVKPRPAAIPVAAPVSSAPPPPAPQAYIAPPQASPVPQSSGDARLAAIREIQAQMADTHTTTQRAMAESHLAYLRATEAAFAQLGGATVAVQAAPPRPLAHAPAPQIRVAAPAPAQVAAAPAPAPRVVPVAPPVVVAAPVLPPTPVMPVGESLLDLVLGVVAEKTGYPRDILALDMDLEADLGIDSIKRVQILAAVQDARPDLPQIDAKGMASLRTLAAILAYLGEGAPAVKQPVHHAAPAVQQHMEPAKALAADREGLLDLVLGIVAEKTGYPRDILALDMDLEADLGIDSIKRVQILAAVQDARPDLPQIDAKGMANLRTLAAILAYLGDEAPAAPVISSVLPKHLSINGLARLGMRETEAPFLNGNRPAIVPGAKLVIIGDADDLGNALVEQFRRRGIEAHISNDVPGDTRAALFLCSGIGDLGVVEQARRAFSAAQGFASSLGVEGGLFVTVQPSDSPLRGATIGLVKTLGLEYPNCSARAIEVEYAGRSADAIADSVAREIVAGGAPEVMLRSDGRRTIMEEVANPIGSKFDISMLQGKPVIVASGGARGVTAACLVALAETAPIRFVLIGRTALESEPAEVAQVKDAELRSALLTAARARGESMLPKELDARARRIIASREVRQTLERLKQLGSDAIYLANDVTDEDRISEALAEVRSKWGQIDGLIHGAGVVADKRITDKSAEQFSGVFGTKVLGLRALLNATAKDPLRFICLFSSVAGRYGNAGQVDYAMANASMSRLASEEATRRGTNCVVRSIGWGPWDGGMVTPELRTHFIDRGIPVIPLHQGVAAFVQELCHLSTDPAEVDIVLAARPNGYRS